jgi:small subunit ribosomal protein S17
MKDDKKTLEKTEKKENTNKVKRKFNGVVVSDKMNKTIVVRIDRVIVHSVTKKRIGTSKRYKVHDELGKFKEGDKVSFKECRPLSKDKKWTVLYN